MRCCLRSDPVLIGPCGVGKSTVSRLLAESLGVDLISVDNMCIDYYTEIGYDAMKADLLQANGGFRAKYDYWKRFEAHAVQRVVADYCNCVFDFGGGHSVFEDPLLFGRVQRVLSEFRFVVLLLPFPDAAPSVAFLRQRLGVPPDAADDINDHFVRHPSNQRLATHVVYTGTRKAVEVCEDVLAIIELGDHEAAEVWQAKIEPRPPNGEGT